MELPFQETHITGTSSLRVFSTDLDQTDLVWHRDPETRIIEAVGDTDWKVQLEGGLPQSLTVPVTVPVGEWHRLVKGAGEVTLKITKLVEGPDSTDK